MLFFLIKLRQWIEFVLLCPNLITIGIMLVIKNVILDEDKIHAQIQEQKKKPRKENRFQKKRGVMEQAESNEKISPSIDIRKQKGP